MITTTSSPASILTVTPIDGEPSRFHVQSSTPGEPYLVDMEEFGRNGRCGCQHFEFRMLPLLTSAQENWEPIPTLRCKHILAVITSQKAA